MGKREFKLLRGLLELGMLAAIVAFIWQGVELFGEWRLSWHQEMIANYEDYYEFKPNGLLSREARTRFEAYTNEAIYEADAYVYTEYLAKWANEMNVKILRFEPYILYEQENVKVVTYLNSDSYDMNWEDFTLPLIEGRWFEAEQNEVICISGFSYKVGDVIRLEDKNGQAFDATVVGKTKYPYIIWNYMGLDGKLESATYGYNGISNVFLLNPQSVHNEPSDLINYGTTLIKTENDLLADEITTHGSCTKIANELIRQTPNYTIPLITMGVCLILFIIFWIAEVIFKRQDKINNYKVVVLREQRNNDIDF